MSGIYGGEAHEIVLAALYLVPGASSCATGAVLKVDGGVGYAAC